MDCSIIIVSYNTINDTIRCLESIFRETPPTLSVEVILVDNASTDSTIEVVRGQFPSVHCIPNNDNKGFAAANNQGLAIAKGEFVLFLNPDTVLLPNTLEHILQAIRADATIGCLGPHTYNGDGITTQQTAQHEPSPMVFFHTHLPFWRLIPGWRPPTAAMFAPLSTTDVDVVQGSCMLLPRLLALEIGGMNSEYFLFSEEHDLCRKVREKHLRVVYFREASIIHFGGTSTAKTNGKWLTSWVKSLLAYTEEHYGKSGKFLTYVSLLIGSLWRLPMWLLLALLPSFTQQARKRITEHSLLLRYYLFKI